MSKKAETLQLAALVQLWTLRHALRALPGVGSKRAPMVRPDAADVWADMLKGFLLGSVLWADKVVLYVAHGGHFDVDVVYVALLPAVLAYNYYFVRLTTAFDGSVHGLREALEHRPLAELRRATKRLHMRTVEGLRSVALVGAILSSGVCAAWVGLGAPNGQLLAVVALASWLLLMTTLLSYTLDYAGWAGAAIAISSVHLVLAVIALTALPPASAYVALAVGEAVLLGAAVWCMHQAWRWPAYTLFWRHAVRW